MQILRLSIMLKNGTPHSRYFSDELGVPNFLQNTELVFTIYGNIWYNLNMEKGITLNAIRVLFVKNL